VEALSVVDLTGKILLMKGDITREQLMPKNFPFYNPDHHKEIYQLLQAKSPLAIVCATGQDLNMVGSQYPFPLFEDGDFDIPSVYMKDIEGERLAAMAGAEILLDIRAERIPATGCNVIARKGRSFPRRVALLAHIDAKMTTPGALDNAAGVIVLLLLAELLAGYTGDLGIEMVAVNGEDYFSSPGERQYMDLTSGTFSDILLGINIDGVGYR
ncbi:MAG: M28 family peptidase, partial [Phycisphaerae bacterium]|nr:M28 family peptidase [Phycisphaerae bacterium]NIX30123.1 M28 family peptidase [Phycisphaerae bacterium]